MNSIIDALKSYQSGLAVCWLGNDGWLLSNKGYLIAFDLDLTSSMRMQDSPISPEELADDLDYLFITHGHGDHFHDDTCQKLVNRGLCQFILPKSCKDEANQIGIPTERIFWVKPDQTFNLASWLQVRTFRALHGHIKHSIYKYANLMDCGYLLQFGEKSIFQPGDTVLLQQHLDMEPVDLLFVSPTEHNTHLEDSLSLINATSPNKIFAQHFGTYESNDSNAFWTRGYTEELQMSLPIDIQDKFIIPEQGKIYYI